MRTHNDFIDKRRIQRLIEIIEDFQDECPVAFVTYGGVPTGPKSIPTVSISHN